MKTAGYCLSLIFLIMVSPLNPVYALLNISMDGDARAELVDFEEPKASLHAAGLSVRKTFADSGGDRFILFGLLEAYDNLNDIMLHEIYGRYKGPMGSCNITAGRFGIPYGLLTDFSATRLLFDSLHESIIGFDADSGVMLSGVIGDFDYGIAGTIGSGPHNSFEYNHTGLTTFRTGYTFGDSGDLMAGLSGAVGKTAKDHGHGYVTPASLGILALDGTIQYGLLNARLELHGGSSADNPLYGAFGMIDYAILPHLDITLAGSILTMEHQSAMYAYAGLGFQSDWFTLRGGYSYDYHQTGEHIISLQIYRLFSADF